MTEQKKEIEGLLDPVPDPLTEVKPHPLDYSQFPGRSNPPAAS